VRLSELRLEDFRCFERFDLELHPQLTLLAGVNGSGRSSVLDGLAVALGSWFLGFHSVKDRRIELREVRIARTDSPHPDFERQFPVSVEARARIGAADVRWARRKNSEKGTTTKADAAKLADFGVATQKALQAGEDIDLPVLAYYGTERLWRPRSSKGGNGGARTSRASAYTDALDPSSDHIHLASWMRWREYDRLQRHSEVLRFMTDQGVARDAAAGLAGRVPKAIDDPWLEAVRRAVCSCIDDCEDFFYSVKTEELCVRLRGSGTQPLSVMSDGYRNLIALVADLAWRATRLNTHREADAPVETAGVVLIDEVELHLHPKWQRDVLPSLMRVFPNIQFVVTTHSAQVMASVPSAMVRVLDGGPVAYRVPATEGRDTNALLEDVMGVPSRPLAMRDQLDRLARHIESDDYDAAEELYDELLGKLGSEDADLTRSRWLIDHERMMGESE